MKILGLAIIFYTVAAVLTFALSYTFFARQISCQYALIDPRLRTVPQAQAAAAAGASAAAVWPVWVTIQAINRALGNETFCDRMERRNARYGGLQDMRRPA